MSCKEIWKTPKQPISLWSRWRTILRNTVDGYPMLLQGVSQFASMPGGYCRRKRGGIPDARRFGGAVLWILAGQTVFQKPMIGKPAPHRPPQQRCTSEYGILIAMPLLRAGLKTPRRKFAPIRNKFPNQ